MTLKKINPEDLVVGREYYVKIRYKSIDDSTAPLNFIDEDKAQISFTKSCPIFTLEQSSTDTELEMLVNVASRIYTDTLRSEPIDECVKKAQKIITACKNALKEGER